MSFIRLIWALLSAVLLLSLGVSAALALSLNTHPGKVLGLLRIDIAWLLLSHTLLGGLGFWGLSRIERIARAPLDDFYSQIRGLSDHQFIALKEPKVLEWVELSKSLNVMVARMKHMIEERDRALGKLEDKMSHDPLTLTSSREVFTEQLRMALKERADGGSVAIIRVNDLDGLNRRLGRNRTDECLVAMSTALRSHLLMELPPEDFVLARMNGADFGLLLPDSNAQALHERLERLNTALLPMVREGLTDNHQPAYFGGTTFVQAEAFSALMVRVDTMLMNAESKHQAVSVTTAQQQERVLAITQWRTILEEALATGHFAAEYLPVVDSRGQVVHELLELHLIEPDGARIPPHEYLPPAIRCGRVIDVELKAVEIALGRLQSDEQALCVPLSCASVARPIFVRRLSELLQRNPDHSRLSFELQESANHPEYLRSLKVLGDIAKAHGGLALGVVQYGTHVDLGELLTQTPLSHIRVHGGLLQQAQQPSVQRFLEQLRRQCVTQGLHLYTDSAERAAAAAPELAKLLDTRASI
ncbi:diguanylate cyclase domain-containing protein [Roseateles sp. BYS180W]|uniref:Diguanylate cyclase domain-containing protein n=1 Tax=Roseateles rivi TaxID=3299028 RepID=A0ABW7FWS7_9BURK